MKTILTILAGGVLGFVLSLVLLLAGLGRTPHPGSNNTPLAACTGKEAPATQSRDFSPDLQALRAESKDLKASLASLKVELSDLRVQLHAVYDDPRQPHEDKKTPAYAPTSPEAEAAWLRLILREYRPPAYREAMAIIEKRFVPALKKYYLDRKTCVGADLETLLPTNLGKTLWRWDDFEFTVKNVNEAEIVLAADPESPKLGAIITFGENVKSLDDQMEMVAWSKSPDTEGGAKVKKRDAITGEARACIGALKDSVRLYYSQNKVLPQSFEDIKSVSLANPEGEYFRTSDYVFGGTGEAFTITCRNVFNDPPFDLTLTVNLKTGEASFNR